MPLKCLLVFLWWISYFSHNPVHKTNSLKSFSESFQQTGVWAFVCLKTNHIFLCFYCQFASTVIQMRWGKNRSLKSWKLGWRLAKGHTIHPLPQVSISNFFFSHFCWEMLVLRAGLNYTETDRASIEHIHSAIVRHIGLVARGFIGYWMILAYSLSGYCDGY